MKRDYATDGAADVSTLEDIVGENDTRTSVDTPTASDGRDEVGGQSDDRVLDNDDDGDDDDELLAGGGGPVPTDPNSGSDRLCAAREIKVDPAVDRVNHTLATLADVLNSSGDFFSHEGQLVTVDTHKGLQIVTPQDFNAYVHPHLEIKRCRGERETFELLDQRTIRALTGSPSIVRKRFREIKYFTKMPSVVGEFRIVSEPGFDARSKVYYLHNRSKPRSEITMASRLGV